MNEKYVRNLFITGATVMLLVIIGTTLLFSRFGSEVEEIMAQKFNEQQLLLARHLKNHIESHFNAFESNLKTLKNEQEIASIIRKISDRDWLSFEPEAKMFLERQVSPFLQNCAGCVRFAITDPDGNPALYAHRVNGETIPIHIGKPRPDLRGDFSLNLKSADTGNINVSRPSMIALAGGEESVSRTVLDTYLALTDGDKVTGWLVLSVDMEMIVETLNIADTKGTNHRWIFDDSGKLVYCSLIQSQEYHEQEIHILKNSKPGSYEIVDAHGDEKKDLLSSTPLLIGDNNWNIVVESSYGDVAGVVHGLHRIGTIAVFLLMTITMAGGLLLYRALLGRMMAEEKTHLTDKLAESEQKFRLLFELAPDPIFVLDAERRVVSLNSGAIKTLKYSITKLADSKLEEIIPNKQQFVEILDKLASTGGNKMWEHTVINGHGETLYFENTTSVLRSDDGKVNFYQTYLHNLTDRLEFEFKLHQDIENLDMIVSSIGAGLALFNKKMQLQWFNERYKEICKTADVDADCVYLEKCRGEKNAGSCTVEKAFKTGKQQHNETKFEFAEGETAYFLITATPLKDSSGEVTQVTELLVDITESKNLESQLAQSDKLTSLGEMAAGLAHELNNPMTGIIGFSEFLMEELKEGEPLEDAKKINKEAIRCSRIIENLLTFTRRHEQQKNPLILNEVLNATVEMVEYEYKINNVVIVKDFDSHLSPVIGDAHELQQVFLNIFNNAFYQLKELEPPKNLWLTTSNVFGGVQLTIENNGAKINERIAKKLFDPFFTTKEVGKGTGLGLSISHGIIKSHHGEISVANTERGVMFTIKLPRSDEPASS